jgi:ribonucleoside-diphosphate reductase beta chain
LVPCADETKEEMLASRSFWPSFFSRIVARLQWDPMAIDLAPDVRAWAELPDERRRRLTTLLAGFCVGEEAVSGHLSPFSDAARKADMASDQSLVAWVFYLQRRDEQRHAQLFDRIAAEILRLPGATPAERREAARPLAPDGVVELFDERLPAMAGELAAGRVGLGDGVGLYHMVLEGIVFDAGQHALLEDLADGALPGVHEGVRRVELDERWHIGFGLRCLIESRPSHELLEQVLARAHEAAGAWGDAVSPEIRARVSHMAERRLAAAHLIEHERPATA